MRLKPGDNRTQKQVLEDAAKKGYFPKRGGSGQSRPKPPAPKRGPSPRVPTPRGPGFAPKPKPRPGDREREEAKIRQQIKDKTGKYPTGPIKIPPDRRQY